MTELLMAVDSGGTRTNIELVSAEGGQVLRFEAADVLSGALSPAEYASTLAKIFGAVERHHEIAELGDGRIYVFMGAAGFAASTRELFLDAIYDVAPQFFEGRIAAMGAANDAVALLFGHEADGVVIAGTGSNVLVRDHGGEIHQAGGHDWVASDHGAGFWIGLRAIRQASKDFEAGIESVLLDRLYEVYGIRDGDSRALVAKMRDLAVADDSMKSSIARFTASTCAAAERGDIDAQNIVKAEAEDLADLVASALRRRLSKEELEGGVRMIQCGSLLGNDFYRSAFESQIQLRLGTTGTNPPLINWESVHTGTSAQLKLASRIRESVDDLTRMSPQFRPVIVRFD